VISRQNTFLSTCFRKTYSNFKPFDGTLCLNSIGPRLRDQTNSDEDFFRLLQQKPDEQEVDHDYASTIAGDDDASIDDGCTPAEAFIRYRQLLHPDNEENIQVSSFSGIRVW
jgi:hypothetical protein